MKKILIRSLSGAIYVALVVFAIYSSIWLDNKRAGFCIFSGLFLAVAMIGLYEYYHNLSRKGIVTNACAGYIAGLLVYVALTILGYLRMRYIAVLMLPAICAIVPLCQLWRRDEHPFATIAYTLLPILWVVVPLYMMQPLGNLGAGLLMMVFICTWVNDTGAYLSGMALGKHHLWERHSPNKTWEGTIGGTVCCLLCAVFIGPLLQEGLTWWYWLLIGLICSGIGTLGDLIESMFKRSCGAKDSGNIMPGHGGILDRFDSMLMIVPFILALAAIGELF